MDGDNLVVDPDSSETFQLPASNVQDIPLISNEINSKKFFGNVDGGDSFLSKVWEPLSEAADSNAVLSFVEGSLTLSITKDSNIYSDAVISQRVPFLRSSISREEQQRLLQDTEIAFNDSISINLPSELSPVTFKRMNEITGVDLGIAGRTDNLLDEESVVVQYNIFVDTNIETTEVSNVRFYNEIDGTSVAYSSKTNTISLPVLPTIVDTDHEMGDDEFVNIQIDMVVLCEERI